MSTAQHRTATERPRPVTSATYVRLGSCLLPVHVRSAVVMVITAVLGCVVFVAGLGMGDYPLPISTVVDVLTGGGTRLERTVVFDWRLARSLVALAVGLALGMAGAITQSTARNALASPDVLGITMGAAAAAVIAIGYGSVGTNSPVLIPAVAIMGGALTAALILLLARGTGGQTYRMVLIGIGVNSMLGSVVSFILVNAASDTAAMATLWLTGSVNGRGMAQFVPVMVVLLVVCLLVLPTARDLSPLQLGESSASSLGVDVSRRRLLLLVAAVVLTAVAVAAAGPVAFVAFVAPQLAVRLQATAHPPLVGSAVCGGVLVLVADLVARVLLPWELPVGVVTAAIGGPFLLYVLVTRRRRTTL